MCPQNMRIEQPLWYRCDRQFMNVMKIISIAFKIAIDLSAEKKVFRMWSPTHKYIHSRIFPFISIRSAVQLSDDIRFNFKRFPFDLVGLFYLWTKNNWKWSNYNTWTCICHPKSSMSRRFYFYSWLACLPFHLKYNCYCCLYVWTLFTLKKLAWNSFKNHLEFLWFLKSRNLFFCGPEKSQNYLQIFLKYLFLDGTKNGMEFQ